MRARSAARRLHRSRISGACSHQFACIEADGRGPFDLIFIDADKPSTPQYVEWAIRLSRPGSLIVVDNVVRAGALADESSDDPRVQAMRQVVEQIGRDPRLSATLTQTVGGKGYDGFILAVVSGAA